MFHFFHMYLRSPSCLSFRFPLVYLHGPGSTSCLRTTNILFYGLLPLVYSNVHDSGGSESKGQAKSMGGDKLTEQVFQLRYTSKGLVRQARKCEAEEAKEKLKIKKAMEKGNMDGARIYAQNAIRKHNEQLNYLRLASRLDAVVARLGTQAQTQGIAKSMKGIVKSLESALAIGNMQKISHTMDQFEKTFANIEVQSEFVESAMAGSTSLSTPEDSVSSLMHQVADDYGLEVFAGLPQAASHRIPAVAASVPANARVPVTPAAAVPTSVTEDELCRRLAMLKNKS